MMFLRNSCLHSRKRLTTWICKDVACIMVTFLNFFGPNWAILSLHHTWFPWKSTNELLEKGTNKSSKILRLRYRWSHQQNSEPESQICIKLMSRRKKVGAQNKEPIRLTKRCLTVRIHTRNGSMNLSRFTMSPSVSEEEPPRIKGISHSISTTKPIKGRRPNWTPLLLN